MDGAMRRAGGAEETGTNLEGNDETARGPFVDHRLQNLRYLIHLKDQASFPRLYLVLALLK